MNNEETIFDRQLRPIVERETLARPAPDQGVRVMPSTTADPRQLAAELRERINPAYANQMGTESYERRLCAEAIEGLLLQRDELLALVNGFHRKLETYRNVYSGDKELRRLLSECEATIAKAKP